MFCDNVSALSFVVRLVRAHGHFT